jgi:hypothetical protein
LENFIYDNIGEIKIDSLTLLLTHYSSNTLESIKTRLSKSNIIILNLYYPIESHEEYYNEINRWNNNIKNQSIKSIDLTNIIKSPNDLTAYIEPSSIGGKKIASAIISSL